MENNYKDENDTKKPQKDELEVDDLKEAMREMKREFRDQMRELKDELSEIKDEPHQKFPRRRPRRPRPPTSFKIDSEGWEDWGERFGESLEHYMGGIMESIGDTLNRSVGSIFSPHKRGKYRGRPKKKAYFVPEEELEEFYNFGSKIMSALSDHTRLQMLKELEKEPLRQSALSEKTDTKGGNFKHHIRILIDEGLVRQEGVRERYMLTFAGREALKLVEFLYSRSKRGIPIPIYPTDEEEEEQKNSTKEEE
ncbi:MAG: ArsR/SmtB family transcription factor [Candidatus Hodarchaeales archaeon]